jgi:hypothetical protein
MKGGPDALGIETIKTFWSRDMKLLVLFMGEPKGELLELKELKGTVRMIIRTPVKRSHSGEVSFLTRARDKI